MASQAGVGFSIKTDSLKAGTEAAQSALAKLSADYSMKSVRDLVLLFYTSKHDAKKIRDGVVGVLGEVSLLIGGGSVGVVTEDYLGYGGYEVAVVILHSAQSQFEAHCSFDYQDSQGFESGQNHAQALLASGKIDTDDSLLFFYDFIKKGNSSQPFNMITPALNGMTQAFNSHWPRTAGMGFIGSMDFLSVTQVFNEQILSQRMISVLIRGDLRLDTVIVHGCKPASDYHEITKTEGPVILEIDHRPATDVISELIHDDSLDWKEYPLYVTLGLNRGDKFAEFNEATYANRLCMAVDHERKGLIMFEPDLKPGDRVQLMRRSIDLGYVRKRVENLMSEIEDRKPVFAFYINCIGRASAYSGLPVEDAKEIQEFFSGKVPFLGVYSGVEIARVESEIQPLDWTGVLCMLSDPRAE